MKEITPNKQTQKLLKTIKFEARYGKKPVVPFPYNEAISHLDKLRRKKHGK